MTPGSTTIVWLRHDLRLADNPALSEACRPGDPVLPVFLWDPEGEGEWPLGGASRWWLHHSLASLDEALRAKGSRLLILRGPALETLRELARTTGARRVIWNRRYEPASIARDRQIKETLRAEGIEAESHNGSLLCEPWGVQNKSGGPFQVFTPFWKHSLSILNPGPPLPTPTRIPPPGRWPRGVPLEELGLLPRIPWDAAFRASWSPGEPGATASLNSFLAGGVLRYSEERDRPAHAGTSRLSPHLHFGEISPRQIWAAASQAGARHGVPDTAWKGWQFITEVGWREFAHHLLFHFPHTPRLPLRHEFGRFPWRSSPAHLKAWQQGRTGYPLVDAGMRELWTTGWMHNRVRMVTASFLVKHLLISWEEGARWFWDTLVDADLASNTLGWQWTAGCGADAAPYFRIFNPISQGEKFDPKGDYIRRWVPELSGLPPDWIHRPWEAPPEVLGRAGVSLGRSYPRPLVDHATARKLALDAYAEARRRAAAPAAASP